MDFFFTKYYYLESSRTVRNGEKPLAPLNLIADFAEDGLMCAIAIMTALYERDTFSKVGKVLDCKMIKNVVRIF